MPNMSRALRRLLAPGVEKAKRFAVKLDIKSSGDSFKINWGSFKASPEVKEQMKAAKGLWGRYE